MASSRIAGDALQNGVKVLTILGLNISESSSDFLVSPTLSDDFPTDSTKVGYMLEPTPGAANRDFSDDIQVDVKRGHGDTAV